MIYGLPFWNDRTKYFVQTNNPTEQYNRETHGEKGFTETCGPTSAVNILAAAGKDIEITTPGTWKPQPEQVLMDYFNDPGNFEKFNEARSDIKAGKYPGNRVPQYYPVAIKEVFKETCQFNMGTSFPEVAKLIKAGKGVQLCLKKPGHYIPIVAYDDVTRELIYNDPYPDRFPDGNGFNRRLTENEFKANVQPYSIIYF